MTPEDHQVAGEEPQADLAVLAGGPAGPQRGAHIAGPTGLSKSGSGTLTLATANAYTGNTRIREDLGTAEGGPLTLVGVWKKDSTHDLQFHAEQPVCVPAEAREGLRP